MSRRRVARPSSISQRCGASGRSPAFNSMKLLTIVLLGAAQVGCGTLRSRGTEDSLMETLRAENERLEAELLELREESLGEERRAGCSKPAPVPSEESLGLSEMAPDEELSRVVLAPEPENEAEETEERDFSASVRLFPEDELAGDSEHTRPVLKVRGQHEAWVYHRPVDETDRIQAALVPAPREPSPPPATP